MKFILARKIDIRFGSCFMVYQIEVPTVGPFNFDSQNLRRGAVERDGRKGSGNPSDILDFQSMSPEGAPVKSAAAGQDLVSALAERASHTYGLAVGVHAVVPGPQYETPAELAVLRALGVTTVSMSGAAETRAARERQLETAMLAVVTNVGETSHAEVLLNTALAGRALAAAVSLVLSSWGLFAPAH